MQPTSETVSRQPKLRKPKLVERLGKHTSPRFARGTWQQPKIALAERVTMVFRRKALHQALADISAADLSMPPHEVFEVAYDRAVAAHLGGEHDKALQLFLSCQKLSPNNPTLAHNIARLQAIVIPPKGVTPQSPKPDSIQAASSALAEEPVVKEATELAIIEVVSEPELLEQVEAPAQPDMIFSREASPLIDIMNEKPGAAPARRLAVTDLWTIVVGTLVLSIGAQYFLGGLGLSNL